MAKYTRYRDGREVGLAQVTDRKKNDTIKWEDLLQLATRDTYGRCAKVRKNSFITDQDKDAFLQVLFSDAKNINPREPVEVSKNTIDINEKIYSNHEGSDDQTIVKIVNSVENSEGHNYTTTTTKGIQWGANVNLGLQFGLPQVGASASGRVGTGIGFQRLSSQTQSHQTTESNKVELQSHHEELVKIPPGKKVVIKMTSNRVRYKMEYTMEYKIARIERIRIKYDPCGCSLQGLLCPRKGVLTPEQLMYSLPGFREDEEYVYFTQEGELRWIADRMEVTKTVLPV